MHVDSLLVDIQECICMYVHVHFVYTNIPLYKLPFCNSIYSYISKLLECNIIPLKLSEAN